MKPEVESHVMPNLNPADDDALFIYFNLDTKTIAFYISPDDARKLIADLTSDLARRGEQA